MGNDGLPLLWLQTSRLSFAAAEEAASAAPPRAGGGCRKTPTGTLRKQEKTLMELKKKTVWIKDQEHAMLTITAHGSQTVSS